MYEHTGHGMLHGIAEESLRKMNRTGLKTRVLLWYQAGIGTRKHLFETFASNVQRNLLGLRTDEKTCSQCGIFGLTLEIILILIYATNFVWSSPTK